MYKSFTLFVMLLTLCTLGHPAVAQKSSKADFTEYGRLLEGEWIGRITLWQDVKDIGKQGDEMTVRWLIKVSQGGHAIAGNGTDGKGTAALLYHYDVEKRQILGVTVFNGGTVMSSVVVKRGDNTWERRNRTVEPDGAKSESVDILVVSDGGNTHTWTRDGKANVWWRLPRY